MYTSACISFLSCAIRKTALGLGKILAPTIYAVSIKDVCIPNPVCLTTSRIRNFNVILQTVHTFDVVPELLPETLQQTARLYDSQKHLCQTLKM